MDGFDYADHDVLLDYPPEGDEGSVAYPELEVVGNLMRDELILKTIKSCFGTAGNTAFVEAGNTLDALKGQSEEVRIRLGKITAQDGWNSFLEAYRNIVADGGEVPVAVALVPECVNAVWLTSIVACLYPTLPRSDSDVYVGNEYRCRMVLEQWLKLDATVDMSEVQDGLVVPAPAPGKHYTNFNWNCAAGRIINALFYHNVYYEGVVPGKQFTWKLVGDIALAGIEEYVCICVSMLCNKRLSDLTLR